MNGILEKVKQSTKYVVENSKEVKINQKNLKRIARIIKTKKPPKPDKELFSGIPENELVQFLFVLDSLNFCFWPEKGKKKWKVFYKKKYFSGFFAFALALKKAFFKYPILDSNYLQSISLSDLKNIFKGQGEIPLLKERQKIIQQNARILNIKYKGRAEHILEKSNRDVEKFIETLIKDFPSFQDTAFYKGKKIYFLKRAQILAADIYEVLKEKGLKSFKNQDKLTCFADYRIPQILNNFGVLEYSKKLTEKIKNKKLIPKFSKEEIEIRANCIWAVEYIKEELKQARKSFCSYEIDEILWGMSKKLKLKIPHHRTKTIYY